MSKATTANVHERQDLQQFVTAHAAEQGMTPEAFAEKYKDSLDEQEFSPAKFYSDALTEKLAADPAGAIREYNALKGTDGGRILSADDARELSEFYRADKTRAGDVHQPVVKFTQRLYEKKLEAAAKEGHKPYVLFTAGGTGAGKSSSLDLSEGRALHTNADIVYDGTLSWEPGANANIQRALDTGGTVAVLYTYRDPVEAFTGGVLKGAMEEGDRKGRTVPLDVHLNTHVNAQKTIKTLMQKYAGNSRVKFYAFDNSHGRGNARVVNFDDLPVIKEDGLKERLQNVLDEEYRAGRISEAVRNGTDGESAVRNKGISTARNANP